MVAAHIIGVGEELAASGEGIEVGCGDFLIAMETHRIVGEVVREDEEEVRFLGCDRWHERKAQNECNLGKEISHG